LTLFCRNVLKKQIVVSQFVEMIDRNLD